MTGKKVTKYNYKYRNHKSITKIEVEFRSSYKDKMLIIS
jgi:hypothetical protein